MLGEGVGATNTNDLVVLEPGWVGEACVGFEGHAGSKQTVVRYEIFRCNQ